MGNTINKRTMGLSAFIKEFYEDIKTNTATGWWGEISGRKGDGLSISFKDKVHKTVYDLIEFLKVNTNKIELHEINRLTDLITQSNYKLNRRRVYMWEYSEEVLTKSEALEDMEPEAEEEIPDIADEVIEAVEEVLVVQPTNLEVIPSLEVKPSLEVTSTPDWDLAKGFIKDESLDEGSAKEALIAYAGTFGVTKDKFDKRKGYGKLVMTFRGHWNKMNK